MNKLSFAAALAVISLSSLAGCKQIAEARKAAEALKAAASAVADAKGPAISSEEDKDAALGNAGLSCAYALIGVLDLRGASALLAPFAFGILVPGLAMLLLRPLTRR